ncbi:MAG: diguanylate cyclase [Clostridia bacterium]|nr:diguanylate cyclase [Clostridia bacterium]
MEILQIVYIACFHLSALFMAIAALRAFNRRHVWEPLTLLSVIMTGMVFWVIGYGFSEQGGTERIRSAGDALSIAMISVVAPLLHLYSLKYDGQRNTLRAAQYLPAFLPTAIALLALATQDRFHLFWSGPGRTASDGGPGFWFYYITSSLYMLAALATLMRSCARGFFRARIHLGYVAVWTVGFLISRIMKLMVAPYYALPFSLGPFLVLTASSLTLQAALTARMLGVEPIPIRAVADSMGEGIILADRAGLFVFANSKAKEILDIGDTVRPGIAMDEIAELAPFRKVSRSQDGCKPWESDVDLTRNGQHFVIRASSRPILDRHGVIAGRGVVLRDITAERVAQRQLASRQAELEALYNVARLGHADGSTEGISSDLLKALVEAAGADEGAAFTTEEKTVACLSQTDGFPRAHIARIMARHIEHFQQIRSAQHEQAEGRETKPDVRIIRKTTKELDLKVDFPRMLVAYSGLGEVMDVFFVLLAKDERAFEDSSTNRVAEAMALDIMNILRRRITETRLDYLSNHDPLTGLLNRRCFLTHAEKLDADCIRPVAVFLFDLDGLKVVNDILGHLEGDKQLVAIANILRSAFGPSAIIARMGGDEFAASLPGMDGRGATACIRKVRQTIDERNVESSSPPVLVSAGWAVCSQPGQSMMDAYGKADKSMYDDKISTDGAAEEQIVTWIRKTFTGSDLEVRLGRARRHARSSPWQQTDIGD